MACNKNLGPEVIERERYIKMAMSEHLLDNTTYKKISPAEAEKTATAIKKRIKGWIRKHLKQLNPTEKKFLRHHLQENTEPWCTFYLLMKVHKTPLRTRPIVSTSGSLLQPMGIWVDSKLQTVARSMPAFINSSLELKTKLFRSPLPDGCALFTADAQSMYTNIDTEKALPLIATYLCNNKERFPEVPTEALIQALEIIMRNNIFTFGDTWWHQVSGTAMGTPPAPPYATVFFGIYEEAIMEEFQHQLVEYVRFIDDIFGIWRIDEDNEIDSQQWNEFQSALNAESGLTWDISDRNQQVNFMDLTITIRPDNTIHTTLFEKAQNLYLYIPPHSAHPTGVLTGIVLGGIHRIYSLCSDKADIKTHLEKFYNRLCIRGYKRSTLEPIFSKGISTQANNTIQDTLPLSNLERNRVFLHLPYNPGNPSSSVLQHIWHSTIAKPRGRRRLEECKNKDDVPMELNRMTVAYSRCLNIGNLLSYRKLPDSGPPASSYWLEATCGPSHTHAEDQELQLEQ